MKQFGVITDNTCEYELSNLAKGLSDTLPKGANKFYELFLKDETGNLVDVPVLVTNFNDTKGNQPNSNGLD
jgi:hypothetical protein